MKLSILKVSLMGVCLSALSTLSACGSDVDKDKLPIEIAKRGPWQEELLADGEIKAATSTPLNVPGVGWDRRNLIMMVADGSLVEKGQVIAKFDAELARVKLSQAETDLLRKELSEIGLKEMTEIGHSQLAADGAKVVNDLTLSQRYANADLRIFERNRILDTLADIGFLNDKQQYLKWKKNQIGARTNAEQALISSQRDSITTTVEQQRKSLSALELVAPHQGVFLLKPRWDGTTPQIGAQLWAGDDFGSLPDLDQQVAIFSVPEGVAFGLKEAQMVKVRLAGTGLELDLKVTKVGKTASTKSRESPVKYSEFEAKIDQAAVKKYALKPGQAITGKVTLLSAADVLTVPNIALVQEGSTYFVYVQNGSKLDKRNIELGLRGPIRSEVKTGLAVGEQVVLIPENKDDKKDSKKNEAQPEKKTALQTPDVQKVGAA